MSKHKKSEGAANDDLSKPSKLAQLLLKEPETSIDRKLKTLKELVGELKRENDRLEQNLKALAKKKKEKKASKGSGAKDSASTGSDVSE